MQEYVYRKTYQGRKYLVHRDTLAAIKRACRVYRCDKRVAAYAGGSLDGITPDLVSHIRTQMIVHGELPARSYVRMTGAAPDA